MGLLLDLGKEIIISYIEELKELAKLKDDGILTEDEFQKKKEEILSSSPESEPLAKQDPSTRPEESASKKKKGFLPEMISVSLFRRLLSRISLGAF